MVLDSLDGRVARMTNTQSAFGAEMDSLSDMVSFGAAPALIVYEWALKGLGKAGWGIAFFYCACAALRLARFNTNLAVVDKRYFQGLPSPAAAALVIGFIWVVVDAGGYTDANGDNVLAWCAAVATIYAGVTMVVNVPFYSFKDLSLKRSVPFIVIVADRAGHRHHQPVPGAHHLRHLLPVRAVGLLRLRLEARQGPAGQRDRDCPPTSQTNSRSAPMNKAPTRSLRAISICVLYSLLTSALRPCAIPRRTAGALIVHV
jgi:CDP-diacylglycerol--serine O-phosphatidyltransferase